MLRRYKLTLLPHTDDADGTSPDPVAKTMSTGDPRRSRWHSARPANRATETKLFIGLPENHERGQESESEADPAHLRPDVLPVRKNHHTDKQQQRGYSSAEADEPQVCREQHGTPSYLPTPPSAHAGRRCRTCR